MKVHLLASLVFFLGLGLDVLAQSEKASIESKHEVAVKPMFLANRPWLYPKCGNPARELVVFDLEKHEMEGKDRTLFASLQGLVNKSRPPELYLIHGRNWRAWLEYLKEKSWIQGYTVVSTAHELLDKYGFKNAVLVDDKLYGSINIATMIAGMEDVLLAADLSLVNKYGLNVKIDLRGRWPNIVDAYQEVTEKYYDRFDKTVLAFVGPNVNLCPLRDYLIAKNIFTMWITGQVDGSFPGADTFGERQFFKSLLATKFPVNIPVLGYPWCGNGYGCGEGPGVTFLSSCGKFLVPTDHTGNLTILTSYTNRKTYKQPTPKSMALDQNGVYVSLLMSDGDNLNTWQGFFNDMRRSLPKERKYGVSWTMGPSIYDLLPPMADEVIDGIHPNDSIGCAVSGIGYLYLKHYASLFGTYREDVLADFVNITETYIKRMDEKWAWVMGYGSVGSPFLKYYARINGMKAIMGGYGSADYHMGQHDGTADRTKANELVEGVPVFHTMVNTSPVDKMIKEVDSWAGKLPRPLFMNVFLFNWDFNADRLNQLGDGLVQRGYNVITPEVIGDLYKESLRVKGR
ncbi:MAG: hypothetical protein KA354_07410 [Phycisphaerae bacterium]|nr:hypothetical protein [Phycisphaerae bacterium]